MQIHIWTPAGELLIFDSIKSWHTVSELQSRLEVLAGVATERQKLTFRGRRLASGCVFLEYGIHEHRQHIYTIELEEVQEREIADPFSTEGGVAYSLVTGKPMLQKPPLVTSRQFARGSHLKEFSSKRCFVASEASTYAPSECTDDFDGASTMSSLPVTPASSPRVIMRAVSSQAVSFHSESSGLALRCKDINSALARSIASCVSHPERPSQDAFTASNQAHIAYLTARRRRLKKAGLGLDNLGFGGPEVQR